MVLGGACDARERESVCLWNQVGEVCVKRGKVSEVSVCVRVWGFCCAKGVVSLSEVVQAWDGPASQLDGNTLSCSYARLHPMHIVMFMYKAVMPCMLLRACLC